MTCLSFGVVTDLHFGPQAYFDGKLRKLTGRAGELLREVIAEMNAVHRPDLLVNLGDDLEDENRDADVARYDECQAILRQARSELVNVAGNHDTVNLGAHDLNRAWQREGHLHYSLDRGGFHLVVLHTVERKDVDVRVDPSQLAWLRDDLAAARSPVIVLMHHSAAEQDLASSRWFSRAPHLALVKERAELRGILEASGKVRAVFNGHLHRNHVDVIRGIPYVTLQSLVENLDDDAPGRAARGHAVVEATERRILVRILGEERAEYQFET